jgi:hypothetical protein
MKLLTEFFAAREPKLPTSGKHILAQFDEDSIIVYQAYRTSIARFAVENGFFGGEFSFNRMSWCKPNFLWMMYRSGWGIKESQEATVAIRLKRSFFDKILAQAVPSSFDRTLFRDESVWKDTVAASDVRLQWDPDHAPSGEPLKRRAIQLGLRGAMLKEYGREAIVEIEDISDFVAEQRANIGSTRLRVPFERVYRPADETTVSRLGLSSE